MNAGGVPKVCKSNALNQEIHILNYGFSGSGHGERLSNALEPTF
jgi:hypothetical protein